VAGTVGSARSRGPDVRGDIRVPIIMGSTRTAVDDVGVATILFLLM